MSPKEIEKALKSLKELKIHPREQVENITLLNRANRMYQELLGNERAWVGQLIAQYEGILEGQNPKEIREARKELQDSLDHFENTPIL